MDLGVRMGSVDGQMVMGLTTNCGSMLTALGWACEQRFGSYFIHGVTDFILADGKCRYAFH